MLCNSAAMVPAIIRKGLDDEGVCWWSYPVANEVGDWYTLVNVGPACDPHFGGVRLPCHRAMRVKE